MADPEHKIVELDDLVVSPGTYFNPQTEVVVIVDDSTSIDQEVFDFEAFEGADWVRISDEVPVDADGLETAMQHFQVAHHTDAGSAVPEDALEPDEDDVEPDDERPEPDPVIEGDEV